MRRQFRVPMAVIAGALLGLIALLATLQYRWLGQISGAERDRMRATLNTRGSEFAQDVDRELTRAYLLFQLDAMQPETGAASGLVARYDRWQATARFPRMIRDVFLATAPDNETWSPLQRFNSTTHFLEPSDWPSALADIRKAIEQSAAPARSASTGRATAVLMRSVPVGWASIPALVVPAPMLVVSHLDQRAATSVSPLHMSSGMRYTIVWLDGDYIRNEMLPGLAQQHFQGTGDGFDYQLAVVPSTGGQPLYHSVAAFSPSADTKVDAGIDLFQVRPRDFEPLVAEVGRFTTYTAISRGGGGAQTQTFLRQSVNGSQAHFEIRSAPMSIVVQSGPQRGPSATMQQQIGGLLTDAAATARVSTPAPAQWRLLVKHPSGSLERAVNDVRRRNLVISTSILGVLGLSVGFLVLSTRRAHELARQQLEFVATVSHELRTPLAVIRSAADNLADGVVNDETRVRQYGQLVRREGLRLTDLVEQILEFAGLQSGQRTMTAKPVAVASLLRDVATTAEATAPDGAVIELALADNLPAVAGDESALRRVFQNLVNNAIKYSADTRWIGIKAVSGGSHVEVSVSDRGIGIAAADQARVFDPFFRAPAVVAAQIQGAGLGLSLVKRIVEAHAGSITLTSAPGQGSTFTVSLPVAEGDEVARPDGVGHAATQPL